MSLFDKAKKRDRQQRAATTETEETTGEISASVPITRGESKTVVDGTEVDIEEPETSQTGDKNWLTGTGNHGRPRGRDALQARKISQTAAMETITNGIVDQLLGGDLTFESDDDETDSAEAEVQALIRDVIEGPHPMGNDLDDLITAAVSDMIGPGNAYWQLLPSENGSLPVVAILPLDPLTIRHNLNQHGFVPEDEPAYWQAQTAFTTDGMSSFGNIEPTPLEDNQLAVMQYPRGNRSYQVYPKSPSLQVLEWLEILVNSTTHHNRFYSDNEVPPGFVQVMNATTNTIEDVKDKLQAAKGDPRKVEVIGGEGQAMWVEMGGTAVNLDVIQEQQWFFELCLGAVGLGKAEVGLIEDVNRANGEVEASRIFKRVTGPFAKQFERAFVKIADQFDVYNALKDPFTPTLRFTDPREERAREERLRKMYNDGGLTLRQYVRRRGDQDLADNELSVELNGETVEYGDHPKFVVDHLLREARSDSDADADMGDSDDPGGGDEAST